MKKTIGFEELLNSVMQQALNLNVIDGNSRKHLELLVLNPQKHITNMTLDRENTSSMYGTVSVRQAAGHKAPDAWQKRKKQKQLEDLLVSKECKKLLSDIAMLKQKNPDYAAALEVCQIARADKGLLTVTCFELN